MGLKPTEIHIIQKYLEHRGDQTGHTSSLIGCELIVIIPCYKEPDLIGTLQSLAACPLPKRRVGVLVVCNYGKGADEETKDLHKLACEQASRWAAEQTKIPLLCIEAVDLPHKVAGVGMARKIGMDTALAVFAATNCNGTLICLDADCRVAPNYLQTIEADFHEQGNGVGEVYFEHRLEEAENPVLREGIIRYELFLRYYVSGLRAAGFPNAIHTIGSCMLCKAVPYARYGGMNKRKAGEDFYFLHKMVLHETMTQVNRTVVYPAARTSDRVPFGTGKAQQDWVKSSQEDYFSYDPRVFGELAPLHAQVDALFSNEVETVAASWPASLLTFMKVHQYFSKIQAIRQNSTDLAHFRRHFYTWFDGFLCLKYVHYCRDHFYPNRPIATVAAELAELPYQELLPLLQHYRALDRNLK